MLVKSFINGIAAEQDKDGNLKWKDMLQPVPNPYYCNRMKHTNHEKIPTCFEVLSGSKTNQKILLVNELAKAQQVPLKMSKKPKDDEDCPYYQPSSQSSNFRAFLYIMRKSFNLKFKEKYFECFEGCLDASLSVVFNERYERCVSYRKRFVTIFKISTQQLFDFREIKNMGSQIQIAESVEKTKI